MIKEFIGTGKTIQEATINARAGLNAPLGADIQVEVIAEPKKKILGLFGGSDAQVKAYYDDGKKERKPQQKKKPAKAPEKKPAPVKENKAPKAEKQKPSKPAPAPAKPQSEKAPKADKPEDFITEKDIDLSKVCAYLKTMIDAFKVDDAKVSAQIVDGTVEMLIECEDYGIIIGRRGETLDALQYLTSLYIKNEVHKYVRVTVNVGDYRSKREATLRSLAAKHAQRVKESGGRYSFEPMNPYERRIIHTAVQEIDGVVSRSVGSGMERNVLLEPEGGVRYQRKGNRGGNRRGGSRPSAAPSAPASDREKRVDRADIPKFGKIEVNKD